MKVLVADSCAEVCWAYRTFLQVELPTATILEVHDASDLLAQAISVCPDLILVQWELPGATASRLLAVLCASNAHIPVIVIGQRADCRDTAMAAGAAAFLCKTAGPDQLRTAVHSVLGGDHHSYASQLPV